MIERIIGFDYGPKRIGVASGNTFTRTAQALVTLEAVKGRPDWDRIARIILEWKPSTLNVGLPLMLDGAEGGMAASARKFGAQLVSRYRKPVIWVDERYSSNHANALLAEAPGQRTTRQRQRSRDGLAAQLILSTYFNDIHKEIHKE